MKNKLIQLLFLSLIFFSCTDLQNYNDEKAALEKLKNKTAPEFFFDYSLNYDTLKNSFNDFKGNVTIIDFWAYWCSPCMKSIPDLIKLNSQKKSNLKIISITSLYDKESKNGSPGKELEKLRRVSDSLKINYPVFIEAEQKIHREFFIKSYPTAVLIGKNAEVIDYGIGIKGVHNLIQKAEAILKNNQ